MSNPVFFVGMPRSGTTIIFEAFSRHPALAWPSNYTARFPNFPYVEGLRALLDNSRWSLVGRKGQYGAHRLGNRYLPHPSEAYGFWNAHSGLALGRRYLNEVDPDQATIERLRKAISRIARWQGKERFAAKFTGPPRIAFLSRVFPEATFVHVVRDGRAVVQSLLKVGFWRKKGGFEDLFWTGEVPAALRERWIASGRDPGVLAALQWGHIVACCRREAANAATARYTEIKYEDFVEQPKVALQRLLSFCGLDPSPRIEAYLESAPKLVNMNSKYKKEFSPEYIEQLTQAMEPALTDYGYA